MSMKEVVKRAIRYIIKGIPRKEITVNVQQVNQVELLKDKKVLITGGSSGLGLEIALKCISLGAKVVITGRDEKKLKMIKDRVSDENLFILTHDVKDTLSSSKIIENSSRLMGGINCLINNAGISLHEKDFFSVTEATWNDQFDINLKGTFFLSKAFIEFCMERSVGNGKILMISSERGLQGDVVPYGLTKAALNSLTKGLSQTFIKQGIRVNAICPGITATKMTGYNKEQNMFLDRVKGERVLIPEEIAELAAYLISDSSNCISGQIIACNEANIL